MSEDDVAAKLAVHEAVCAERWKQAADRLSQDLVGMLTLATARGALAPGRAAQIIAGTPAP